MKKIVLGIIFLLSTKIYAQQIQIDTIGIKVDFENILNSKLYSDSLVSSFIILVKNEVKEHKHVYHTEHIVVLEGSAIMTLGDSSFTINKDDVVVIPKNTFHSVKTISETPLKVISIQAPLFDGTDRVFRH